jgi:serine/threonine-protein kinase
VITSAATRNSYTMGQQIGEGVFGVVFACTDFWGNDLAVKVLKPRGSYEQVKAAATAEITKLLRLRHPYITYVFDAFEFRDTFHIVTERCYGPLTDLYRLPNFNGLAWLLPIARCLLQAVHFLHVNLFVHQDIHLGNVFAAFARDEMLPQNPGAIHFKLADLGVAKFFNEVDVHNTRAEWMLPPEVLNSTDLGPIDRRVDLYHVGLLLLQLATSQQLVFTREEVLAGRPRELALTLPPPYNTALEKSLRRHVPARTASAMELWRDLKTGEVAGAPAIAAVSS